VLPETAKRLLSLLDRLAQSSLIAKPSIFFVDDESSDGTWPLIESLAAEDARIHGIKLSRSSTRCIAERRMHNISTLKDQVAECQPHS